MTALRGQLSMDAIEKRTIGKVSLRLVPFLMLCYFVAYLDRVNVGFAALTMNKELGLSASVFGFGAGIFFFRYFIFEGPSNLMLEKFGARRWIARIMFSWGVLSGCIALVSGEYSFYLVRVLLGIAEAGFFPGIIFYLTLWFPGVYRARIVGWFMAAIPLSSVLGFPVSGYILGMEGFLGLAGWKCRRRGRHRGDQLGGQSVRVLWSVRHGLAEGPDWRFLLRAVGDRRLRGDGHGHRPQPASRRATGACSRPCYGWRLSGAAGAASCWGWA
jgi:MFS family permease